MHHKSYQNIVRLNSSNLKPLPQCQWPPEISNCPEWPNNVIKNPSCSLRNFASFTLDWCEANSKSFSKPPRTTQTTNLYSFFFCFFPCPASSNDLSPWMNNDRLFRFIVVAAAWRRWPDKRARGYININSKQTTGRSMYHHHAIPDWTGTKLCASEIHNELSSSTSLEWIGREFSWDYAR